MSSYEGYGVNLEKARFIKDAEKTFWETAKGIEWVREKYRKYRENCRKKEEATVEGFIDGYLSDEVNLSEGFEGFITDVINELADPVNRSFVYEDCCLVVPAGIPVDEKDRASILTMKQIREILTRFLGPILEEPVVAKWYDIST